MRKSVAQIIIFAAGWPLLFLLVSAGLTSMRSASVLVLGLLSATIAMSIFLLRGGYLTAKQHLNDFGAALKANNDYGLYVAFTAGLGLAIIFQVINRYSSGPSGADTVFFLTTVPVFAIFLGFLNKEKTGWAGALGVAIALAGGIMVVANWERPSSFSPFALYPKEELLLLVSAFGLALFAAAGKRLCERYNPDVLLTVSLWAISIIAVILTWPVRVLFSLGSIGADGWLMGVLIGVIGIAVPLYCLLGAVRETKVQTAVAAVMLMPALITCLIVAEKLSGYAAMLTPFAVMPVLAGIGVIAIGIGTIWLAQKEICHCEEVVSPTRQSHQGDHPAEIASLTPLARKDIQSPTPLASLLLVFALAQTAWSIIALFFIVETTHITGKLDSGAPYSGTFNTPGYNTVAGLLMVIAGFAAIFAAYDFYSRRASAARTVGWAAVSAALIGSTFLSGKANIVAWSTSIPAEIQHAFGSVYVTVTEVNVTNIPLLIAYGFAAVFVLLALILWSFSKRA